MEIQLKTVVGYDGSDASRKARMPAKQYADIWRCRKEAVCAVFRKEPLIYQKIQHAEHQLAHQVESINNIVLLKSFTIKQPEANVQDEYI